MTRFGPSSPCPVCRGHDRAPRGNGQRCAGFLSEDAGWARCTREEHAGGLALDERTTPPTYAHRLDGPCRCGEDHRGGAVGPVSGLPAARMPHNASNGQGRRIVAKYRYRAADGGVLFEVVRTDPKGFYPRHADPTGAMVPGLPDGIPRVPYRLPELLAEPSRALMWVEGEKDADRLAGEGLLATTTVGGTDGYRRRAADYAEHFRGRRLVAVVPDNDAPGHKYAEAVAASLHAVGATARIVELPGLPSAGDVSDWLEAGHTADELRALVKAAPPWVPALADERPSDPQPVGVLLSDVHPERIDWVWPTRLARGKVTLIDGDPGNGKSALTLDAAARITTGTAWPDGAPCPSGGVVLLTAEDGLADTVRPRLDAVGADSTRVVALPLVGTGDDARLPSIPADLSEVERAIRRVGARLLIVDPLMAYLGSDVSSHKDQDVRRALAPLASMAEREGVAVAVVRHLNKTNSGPAMYRGGGSIGIIGAARISLLVGRDQSDATRLVLAAVKTNIGPKPASLAYRLEPSENGVVRLMWEPGECSLSAAELLDAGPYDGAGTVTEGAVEALRGILADGPVEAKVARRLVMEQSGASARTIDTAKAQLGVASRREGFGAGSRVFWTLTAGGSEGPDSHRTQANPIHRNPQGIASYGETLRPMDSGAPGATAHPPPPPTAQAPAIDDLAGDAERDRIILAGEVRRIFRSNPHPNPAMWPEPMRSALAAELARRAASARGAPG